ncbi:hypothetical protein [Enterovirga sp.]|uniref:lipoate--protein ligase family protein n=1 Tax=Enterovirga sp. TaxID=2026350 RepID=UPI002B798F4C|nr:hypothetical protein [Enterovirga sp.]HMO30326.1 hypothetical protein [Enterovirga sp.]
MSLRVLDTGLRPARWNVAMSAALLAGADAGEAPATLRLHRYPLSCVIGRNQDVAAELDLDACRAAGIEIARRVTGGGAVVMGPGVLAFDLVLERPGAEFGRRAAEALAMALVGLGFPARLATTGSIEIADAKVSGSAGRLGRRAALHQATLVEDLSRTAPLALLRRRTEGGKPTADPRHRVGDLRSFAPVVPGHLARCLAAGFGLKPEAGLPSPAECARAEDILAHEIGRDDYVFENAWSRAA